jgi:DNA-binding response OmpR family regulator
MATSKGLVLCLDDDEDMLECYKTVLEADGYTVIGVLSAEEGVRACKKQMPDVIVADLMMEEVDAGTTFVKEIRAMGCTVPVYMVSSVGDALNRNIDYGELGLKGVLQKPVDIAELLKLVAKAVNR